MKLLFILLLSSPFLVHAEDVDGSGEDPVQLTTSEPEINTARVGSFVIADLPGTRRICTCAELHKCSFITENTQVRDECSQECSSHLSQIDNDTLSLTGCFHENYLQELEVGNRCIRSYHQDLCSNYLVDKKVSDEYWGLNKQFDEPIINPLYKSSVFMMKAELIYNSIRNYQRCFTNCHRRRENNCQMKLNCKANYPTTEQLEETLAECLDFRQAAFSNARVSCKCMISRKNIVKLIGLCSLFTDNIMAQA